MLRPIAFFFFFLKSMSLNNLDLKQIPYPKSLILSREQRHIFSGFDIACCQTARGGSEAGKLGL